MRFSKTTLLAGAGALVLAGGLALASSDLHTMTVRMPDGGVATIRYTGDVKPQVSFANNPFAVNFAGPPFAIMDRISAQMDRQMAAMIVPFAAMNANPLMAANLGSMPSGMTQYTSISTMSGGHFCTRTTQITSVGEGQKPKVVSQSSGDCGLSSGAGLTTVHPLSPATQSAGLTQARGLPDLRDVAYR